MANTLKGEGVLKLSDGREFILVMDMEAMFEGEYLYRRPLERLLADATQGLHGAFRAMLWGMLRAKHPEITPEEATDIVLNHRLEVMDALERVSASAQAAKSSEAAEGKNGENPPGKRSGSSGAKRASNRKTSGGKPRARSR